MEDCKVLVIEDDESAKNVLARVIKKEGFSVLTAENGRAGFDLFTREKPQIVITDLKMPEMSGMEVLKNIKKISPATQVILMTAFGEVDITIEALREGALDYIKKPIDLEILSVALGRAKEKIDSDKKISFIPHVLVAEDDSGALALLVKLLEKDGNRVAAASDGEEALSVFRQEKIDIVLTDIKMPKIDGLTALHEMRAMTDDFEAIVMTGYGDENSAIKAMHEGAMNYLKKPIDYDNLMLFIKKAVDKLLLARALKYRTRDLELAQRTIAEGGI